MRTSAVLLLALIAVPSQADASCIPGFDHAIFTRSTIKIQGNAGTDSYDSSVGTYAATNSCAAAHIGSKRRRYPSEKALTFGRLRRNNSGSGGLDDQE